MSANRDISPTGAELYFLPVHTRVPLKFGGETVSYVTCARVRMCVRRRDGSVAEGWGETPLSVTWVWPSSLSYDERHEALRAFCERLLDAWVGADLWGHPIEIGSDFIEQCLPKELEAFNRARREAGTEPMPWLAALVCLSLFDIATHDAYGIAHDVDIYQTYNGHWMNRSLESFLEPASHSNASFAGKYPEDYLKVPPPVQLPAWHLVGGADPLDDEELTGQEPDDEYPNTLLQWIESDGLKLLKIKLRGNDATWDWERLVKIGNLSLPRGVDWLTADFNCMVTDPNYVNELLDRLRDRHPRIYGALLYVEQPFPYELDTHPIDVHSVSARKPLFLDESAHDWRQVRRGRELGWTGVALKTCKTQTGALLSACWAREHGMTLMVQDLTNPMLAQIPHARLGSHVGTIMGVETNGMQFYPEASAPEAQIHPQLYRRRDGHIDLSSLHDSGFGYRNQEIQRQLPPPSARAGTLL